jgi:hypothetical protein|tara:strand:- start:2122 stop:2688 length:567 start_codon:yes stop_codon:yes gene_type:complete
MKQLLLSSIAVCLASTAMAAEPQDSMIAYVNDNVRQFFMTGPVQSAVRFSGAKHADLGDADIAALDQRWRLEIGQADQPTVSEVAENELSHSLQSMVEDSGGIITEIIVMDNRGLNVAVSSVTSDFWQGDEAKYQQTYLVGPDAVHVSDVDLDESSQTYQAQVSFVIVDKMSGSPIGAVTVGVNAEAF